MRFCTLALTLLFSAVATGDELPSGEALQRDGAVIGKIRLERSNIFDLSNPEEDRWLFRLANRLHIVTRDRVIRKQLLLRSGDTFSLRQVAESERVLRQNRYLFDASVVPIGYDDGVVDLEVRTRDVWTLTPDISLSRKGGENRSKIGFEDTNLLGRGQLLRISRIKDVDRTANSFQFSDRHLGRSWVSGLLRLSNNSDGKSRLVSAIRPFYALDTRWSAGGWLLEDERREAL
jgi:hypothetical protein